MEYQSKLLEAISMAVEKPKHDPKMKQAMNENLTVLQKQIFDNPAVNADPKMKAMINNILSMIPKGG